MTIQLRASATCNGASPIPGFNYAVLTVDPVPHTFSVSVGSPSPYRVASGGTTSLSATPNDSRTGHTFTWSWSDGGAGGSFSDFTAENPTYTAPANTTDGDQTVTLTVAGFLQRVGCVV